MFIAGGKNIRHTTVNEMRTVDVYPTLLEMLDVKVPKSRSGYVVDIFEKTLLNTDKQLPKDIRYKKLALIQTHEPCVTDIVLNELYIASRFSEITVVGEAKYEELYRNNPRVSDYITADRFSQDNFDEVYCGFYNQTTGLMSHIKIK